MNLLTNTKRWAAALLALLSIGAVALPAAVSAKSATSTVRVTLKDLSITPAPKTAKAGKVTFVVKNAGTMPHQLVVIKTNLKAGKLPVSGGKASEKGKVGAVTGINAGKTKKLTLTLKKGHYALICNIPGHYQVGMHADFTVS